MSNSTKIINTFNVIKKEYDHCYLKKINNNYYVYKQRYTWHKEKRKSMTISEYIGRITIDGKFIKKVTSYKDELEKAESIVTSYGGKIIWEKNEHIREAKHIEYIEDVKKSDLKLLTAMSMNSRMPASKLAELTGLNEQTTYSRLKVLENRLDIKYILEIDVEKLGYIKYLILIKFEDKIPTIEELRKTIEDEYTIQFAVTTRGRYDVVMYVIDKDPLTANNNLFRIRTKPNIRNYRAQWNLIYFAEVYSFVPISNEFVENVLKDSVWHRTKESPRPNREQLKYREWILLKELNKDSVTNFSFIDDNFSLPKGTSRYAYDELRNKRIIVRPTISISSLPMKYIGIIMIENIDEDKIQEHRYKYLLEIIKYDEIVNKYSLMGNIGAPNGGIMFFPVTENESIDEIVERIDDELQGSKVSSLIVTEIIRGSLCYRRFDNAYSRQYGRLREFGKIDSFELINYEK